MSKRDGVEAPRTPRAKILEARETGGKMFAGFLQTIGTGHGPRWGYDQDHVHDDDFDDDDEDEDELRLQASAWEPHHTLRRCREEDDADDDDGGDDDDDDDDVDDDDDAIELRGGG